MRATRKGGGGVCLSAGGGSKALPYGVLCQVESHLSQGGLWLRLAFLSKVPLIRPEIIEVPGHCHEAAVAKK